MASEGSSSRALRGKASSSQPLLAGTQTPPSPPSKFSLPRLISSSAYTEPGKEASPADNCNDQAVFDKGAALSCACREILGNNLARFVFSLSNAKPATRRWCKAGIWQCVVWPLVQLFSASLFHADKGMKRPALYITSKTHFVDRNRKPVCNEHWFASKSNCSQRLTKSSCRKP